MDAIPDKILVATFLITRDDRVFRQLYRRHTGAMYRIALRWHQGDADAAAEAVQEAWVRVVEGLGNFRWSSTLRTWLCGAVINCCREMQRRSAVKVGLVPQQREEIRPQPTLRLDIDRALAVLPEGYREVFVLHDLEGYKHGEIGGLLGIAAGTSKSQLSHARSALRGYLTDLPRQPKP